MDIDKKMQIVTKALVGLWAMALVTYAVVMFFGYYELTTASQATVVVAIVGIPSVAFSYRWIREWRH